MKTEVEKILLNVINDFNSKWLSHSEKDAGVSEYAEKIVKLFSQADVISRASKIKKARDIVGRIFMLYDEKDKTGHWELNKATDAIYAYIKELEQS